MPDVEELIEFARRRKHPWAKKIEPDNEGIVKETFLVWLYRSTQEQRKIRALETDIEGLKLRIRKAKKMLRLLKASERERAERGREPKDQPVQSVYTAGCEDIDPHTPCMHDRSSRLLGGTVCRQHTIQANYTEIRCSRVAVFSHSPAAL